MYRFLWLLASLSLCASLASAQVMQTGAGLPTPASGGGNLACSFSPNTTATYNVAYSSGTPSVTGGSGTNVFTNSGTSFSASGFTLSSTTGAISGTDVTDSGGATYPGIQIVVTDSALDTANCSTSFTITVLSGYVGPVDIVAAPLVWGGLRAMSVAYAGGKAIQLCDHLGNNCSDVLTSAATGALTGSLTRGSDDCSTLTTCTVYKVYDQTVGGHCAGSCDLVPVGAVATFPRFNPNCINSLPCLVATGGAQNLATLSSFTSGAQPFWASIVVEQPNNTSSNSILATMSSGNVSFSWYTGSVSNIYAGTYPATGGALTYGHWHATQWLVNGASSTTYIDGSSTTTANTPGANTMTNRLEIFGSGSMYLTEFGVWAGSQATHDSAMNSNQTTYWGPF